MARVAVTLLLLITTVLAIDQYNDMPISDFDDYEMYNEIDTGRQMASTDAYMTPRYYDSEDWRRNLIFYKLLKAFQSNQWQYRSGNGVNPNSMENVFDTAYIKKQLLKRAATIKEEDKTKLPNSRQTQRTSRKRQQTKGNAKKEKMSFCLSKLCSYRLPKN